MKCLVTGGAGFIGSHLVDLLLKEGHSVIALDNLSVGNMKNLENALRQSNFEFHLADVSLKSEIERFFCDVEIVFHLAGLADIVPSIENPDGYFNANVIGTYNVAQLSASANVKKVVYAASSSCYGIPEQFPTSEGSACNPQYPYALTKYLGEQVLMHWNLVYDLPVNSLRLFNVYGPRARTSGTYGAVFGVFLAQKLAGKPFTRVGDGSQTRDFTYVSDVTRAFYMAGITDKVGLIMNVGSGGTYSVNRVIELLGGPVVTLPKRPGEPDCTFADISTIRKELSWEPSVDLSEGISKLLEHIEDWKDAPLWDVESIERATKSWFNSLGR
ncbi:WcaG Nucleoside-diphosphate-sugar epimerases [Candidatus Nanopelagicaceae bacterium]